MKLILGCILIVGNLAFWIYVGYELWIRVKELNRISSINSKYIIEYYERNGL